MKLHKRVFYSVRQTPYLQFLVSPKQCRTITYQDFKLSSVQDKSLHKLWLVWSIHKSNMMSILYRFVSLVSLLEFSHLPAIRSIQNECQQIKQKTQNKTLSSNSSLSLQMQQLILPCPGCRSGSRFGFLGILHLSQQKSNYFTVVSKGFHLLKFIYQEGPWDG